MIQTRLLLLAGAFLALWSSASAQAPADDTVAAARELYHARQTPEAQAAFDALARSDPQNAEVQYYLGLLCFRRDDPAAAEKFLERAVELAPEKSEYHRRLGDAYGIHAQRASLFSKPGLAKRCLRAYESAVAADPTSIDARWSVMEFHKVAPGFLGGSLKKAYAQAEEIARLDATGGRWARALLLLHEHKGHEAIPLYDGALTAEPADYAALYQLGRLCQWSGQQLEVGRQALEKCLTLPPQRWAGDHKEVHVALGRICQALQDPTAARAAFEAALVLDPAYQPALDALAELG